VVVGVWCVCIDCRCRASYGKINVACPPFSYARAGAASLHITRSAPENYGYQ
jgi:hypothetical protein